MKMPRFFIIIGACGLLFIASQFGPRTSDCLADPLPIMRADPWAGDPEEPGFSRGMPFDEGEQYGRIAVPYETSAPVRPVGAAPVQKIWWVLLTSTWAWWR